MLNFTPIILWTDALLFILVGLVLWLLIENLKKPYMRKQWRRAFTHPTRTIAMVILLFYISIGLLDSIHYRPKTENARTEIKSVLDLLLQPRSEQLETSYSPPFATELFNQKMVKTADAEIRWVNENLNYVTAVKVWPIIFQTLCLGALFWVFLTIVIHFILRLNKQRLDLKSPWFVAWATFGVIATFVVMCKELQQYYHIFGTDKIGTDVFYASVKSIRTGLIIGTLTTLITMPFAIIFGALAGYLRGWVDDAIQYLYTTLSSVPAVLLIAAAALTFDAVLQRHSDLFPYMEQRTDIQLLILCCILGLTSWTSLCRIIRGETLKLREQDFVAAAKVLGLNNFQIILKHVVPNLMHIILISIVLDFSGLVLAEAVLSYVGVGVDPSMYSWGNMINSARMELGRDPIIWWSLTGAFALMFMLVLAANIFADGVRDTFDTRAEL